MATLSLTILPAKALKGGRHKVRIAVAHNGTTRYITTDVVLDNADQFKNGRVVRRPDASYLNTKLMGKVMQVQEAIDGIMYTEGLSCPELIEVIKNGTKRNNITIAEAFEELQQVSDIKQSTVKFREQAFRSISRLINPNMKVSMITPIIIQKYIKARRCDVSDSTVRNHLVLLAQIINFCQRNGYTEFRRSPMEGLMLNVNDIRQNWLSPQQVRFIRDIDTRHKATETFRDMFMLSYYLGGINMIDILRINFLKAGNTLKYVRCKTERRSKINKYVEFKIPAEAKPIIDKYVSPSGMIVVYKRKQDQIATLGAQARSLCARYPQLGYMTFYSARKSFAQHAFKLGISESVIDYILGHSLGGGRRSSLYSYISVTPEMATAALRKVLDFLAGDGNLP